MFLHGSSSVGPKPPGKNSGAGFALTFHSLQATLPLHLSLPLSTAAASHQQQASSHHHHQQQHASSSSSATASNVRDREAAKATNKTPGTPSTPSGSDSGLGLTTEMAYKKKRLKRNRLFCRAPIASFDCMEDGMLSTDSSLTPNPPSRQLSLCYPQGIKYKNLGKTGLRISSLGLGTWVTFGSQISEETAEEILTAAYESGITVFDTADVYAGGKAEMVLGNVLKKKGWRRSSYIVNTKLFWGNKPDSERGLSRKHIIEGVNVNLSTGLQASLERLQLSYVDIVFANKADPMCPMEEIVRAFTHCINQGWAMYWGTSRWSAMDIMESYTVARQFNLIPPVVEQTEYHMFQREKVELHLPELYHKIGVGTITWSPQAFGVLTGKFDEGVQLLSRGSVRQQSFTACHEKISSEESGRSPRHQSKMQELTYLADKLGCTPTQLTIAWCLKNEGVQCVLVGAFSVEQLYDNLQALQVVPKLTSNILNEVEKILDNKPVRQPVQR